MKHLIRITLFLTIIMIIVFVLARIYNVKMTDYIDDWSDSSTVAEFYNEPEDSLDVLIFGTSTTSNGVQPAVLWNQEKITSYNLSTEQQHPLAAYYLLMESLKYQHPEVVIIHARWVTTKDGLNQPHQYFDEDDTNAVVHLALDYMKLSKTKLQAARDIASHSDTRSAFEYLFPFILYHSRDNITSNDFDDSFLSKQHVLKGSCVHLNNHKITLNYQREENENLEVPATYDFSGMSPTYVEKMIETCHANGIKVLLLSLPISDWDWQRHMEVQAFADTYGATYLDLNDENAKETILDPKTDFLDTVHENIFGSYKTSGYVASFLAANYKFDLNATEEVSTSFDQSYADFMNYYHAYQAQLALKDCTNFEEYLDDLSHSDDYVVIISAKDDFLAGLSQKQKEALHALGLNTDFNSDLFRHSYIAVIDSRKVVYEECAHDSLEFSYSTSNGFYDKHFHIESAGFDVGDNSSIKLSGKEYSLNQRGLNIVVFSKLTDRVIDRVNFDTSAGSDGCR